MCLVKYFVAPAENKKSFQLLLECNSKMIGYTKKSNKTKKKSKRLQLHGKKLRLTTLLERRMRSKLIETFKITMGISNYSRHF